MDPSAPVGSSPPDWPEVGHGAFSRSLGASAGLGAVVGIVTVLPLMVMSPASSLIVLVFALVIGTGVGLLIGLPVAALTVWASRHTDEWRAVGTLASSVAAGALLQWWVAPDLSGSGGLFALFVVGSAGVCAWIGLPWILRGPARGCPRA